jgi:hypothetical protein
LREGAALREGAFFLADTADALLREEVLRCALPALRGGAGRASAAAAPVAAGSATGSPGPGCTGSE